MVRPRIAIILPTKNEENTISDIILSLLNVGDLFIVDDCSTDNTNELIRKFDVEIITNLNSMGYEKSIWKGIRHILSNNLKYDYIATFDADGEHDPSFFKGLDLKDYDVVIAKRDKFNRISEHIFSFFSKIYFNIEDMLSGLRVYKVSFLNEVENKIKFNFINIHILILSRLLKKKVYEKNMKVSFRKDKSRFGSGIKVNIYIIYVLIKSLFVFLFSKNR